MCQGVFLDSELKTPKNIFIMLQRDKVLYTAKHVPNLLLLR